MSIEKLFESKFKVTEFPEIDVKERVMKQISLRKDQQQYKLKTKVTVIAVSTCIFLLLTGFASAAIIGLKNQSGQFIFSLKGYDEENSSPTLAEEIVQEHLEKIQPGEAIAIYSPYSNPDNVVTAQEKPIYYYELEEFRTSVLDERFFLPATLPDNIIFEKGLSHHKLGYPDTTDLINQSQANGGVIVSEKIPVYEEVQGITMEFTIDGEKYEVFMHDGSKWHTVYTDLKKVEDTRTIPFENSEVLLVLRDSQQELIWKTEQPDMFYSIKAQGNEADKELKMMTLLRALIN